MSRALQSKFRATRAAQRSTVRYKGTILTKGEITILKALDAAVRCESTAAHVDEIASSLEQELARKPDMVLVWKPIALGVYSVPLPSMIRSSWVFVLRADTVTGAERHPNSHQRMMSYRGAGDFQTKTDGPWCSHHLSSVPGTPLEERWISIPPNIWHQGVVAEKDWIVVSFHTVLEDDLIEERPGLELSNGVQRRKYVDETKCVHES